MCIYNVHFGTFADILSVEPGRDSGDETALEEANQRCRGSMKRFLELTELPDMSSDPHKLEELEAMRSLPMKEEQEFVWALQEGGDVNSRVALPPWIGRHIAFRVASWSWSYNRWQDKIGLRLQEGKNLTAASQKEYEKFLTDTKVQKMLFNKVSKCLVTKIRKNISQARLEKEMFSVQIMMSAEPESLKIQAGNGEITRLVLLRGQPVVHDLLPPFLDKGVAQSVMEAIEQGDENEELGAEDPVEPDDPEGIHENFDDIDVQEAQQMEALEAENDLEEVLCDTEEEDELAAAIPSGFVRVKDFMSRASWKTLDSYGLAVLPPGVSIGYHKTTRCWQAYYEGSSKDLSSTHSGTTNRTETESLFRVVRAVLEKFVGNNPKDKMWKQQLQKASDIEAKIAKL